MIDKFIYSLMSNIMVLRSGKNGTDTVMGEGVTPESVPIIQRKERKATWHRKHIKIVSFMMNLIWRSTKDFKETRGNGNYLEVEKVFLRKGSCSCWCGLFVLTRPTIAATTAYYCWYSLMLLQLPAIDNQRAKNIYKYTSLKKLTNLCILLELLIVCTE